MPELPEVETIKSGLETLIKINDPIEKLELYRPDLRFTIPKNLENILKGSCVVGIERRAKYILFKLQQGVLLSHLGMTGSWRNGGLKSPLIKHDHCKLVFGSGLCLIYNDPRRFGFLDWIPNGKLARSKWLKHLGPEPLDGETFNSDYLFEVAKKSNAPIKSFIMNQKMVVGVGNIYACEALFIAGIRPTKRASLLSRKKTNDLVSAIKQVLFQAIKQGGSSISDFKKVDGDRGYFQNSHKVYGKEFQPCGECGERIKKVTIAGRSSFYCPKCQT